MDARDDGKQFNITEYPLYRKPVTPMMTETDLFTPTHFAYFLRFLGFKLRTTNHYNKTTQMRKSRFFNKFSSILTVFRCNDPVIVIVSTVNKQAD